jgi:hypothetical protein
LIYDPKDSIGYFILNKMKKGKMSEEAKENELNYNVEAPFFVQHKAIAVLKWN